MCDPAIPLLPAMPLVGRDEEMSRLRERLHTGGNVALTALNGLPGVGKTALAIALAHDQALRAQFCDGVLWAAAEQCSALRGGVIKANQGCGRFAPFRGRTFFGHFFPGLRARRFTPGYHMMGFQPGGTRSQGGNQGSSRLIKANQG